MALATMTVSGAVERHGAGELATGRGYLVVGVSMGGWGGAGDTV